MIRQQIMGIINLSLPLIVLYNLQPMFLLTFPGQIFCSLVLGAYICYVAYQQLRNLEKTLQYCPTGDHKDFFDAVIRECGIDPDTIVLRYAYTNENIAMTAGKTIIIDPVVWHDIEDDVQAVKVHDIFKNYIQHTLAPQAKQRITATYNLLNSQVQRFILKHEVAHVLYNFSHKKLIVIFIVGALSAYIGIFAALSVLPLHGLFAIFVGMIIGGLVDLLLTYCSNLLWKLEQEKKADRFAVQYSSNEDIQAAAEFFEKHQDVLDMYKESNYLALIPLSLTAGYQDGGIRAKYLLQLMAEKNC